MQHTFWMCCPCHFGLEHTLHFELKKLGAEQIQVQDGRIYFGAIITFWQWQTSVFPLRNGYSYNSAVFQLITSRSSFKA